MKIQIKPNQRVVFQQADLTQHNYAEVPNNSIDLYYTDPPWNDGNVKMFYTILKKQTGVEKVPPAVGVLLRKVFQVAGRKLSPNGILCLECSVDHHELYDEVFATDKDKHNLQIVRKTTQVYDMGKPRPLSAWFFQRKEATPDARTRTLGENQVGLALLKQMLTIFEPKSFLDTSTGLGLLTGEAIRYGVERVYGFELNEGRLAKARGRVGL